jgi:hypothetical protein
MGGFACDLTHSRGVSDGVSRVAPIIGLGVCLVAGPAAADGSAIDAVLRGDIPWVTTSGVRPSAVPHQVEVDGDMVLALPLDGTAPTAPLASSKVRAATLYLAMDGITLHPECPTGDWAHAAFDCTSMVTQSTTMPAMSGATAKAQLAQAVQDLLAPFDIAVTTERPPAYLPYFLVAVGGNSNWTGSHICGLAHVGCGGQRRNLVSVNFPTSQYCDNMAATIGHELGHNIGLEHTSFEPDLMFPSSGPSKTPQNTCSSIALSEGKNAPSCPNHHAEACPNGNGNAQNTYAELMSRVGPRRHDVEPPALFDVWPPNGSVFTPDDTIPVTARVEDEGGTVGVRWRWLEGLPPGYDAYEQCTNDACELAFAPEAHVSGEYAFVNLDRPPVGKYSFRLDAIDAHGNQVMAVISIRVEEPIEEPEEEATTGDEPDAADDGETDDLHDPDEESIDDDEALPPGYGGGLALDADVGCGCRGGSPSPLALLMLLPWLAASRRRRRA